ncbi:MAG: hypothetical protein JWN75_435 [Candidatus Saccharibacteria bacterium]|nr:hypothetical protein [Candidatus Saccharibacteria bacterium]
MHKLFHRFGRKDNVKILRRELAFAHTCITLLAIGMIVILSALYDQIDGLNQALVITVDVLLAVVALISVSIVGYILKSKK